MTPQCPFLLLILLTTTYLQSQTAAQRLLPRKGNEKQSPPLISKSEVGSLISEIRSLTPLQRKQLTGLRFRKDLPKLSKSEIRIVDNSLKRSKRYNTRIQEKADLQISSKCKDLYKAIFKYLLKPKLRRLSCKMRIRKIQNFMLDFDGTLVKMLSFDYERCLDVKIWGGLC